jgi:hypothetical protein
VRSSHHSDRTSIFYFPRRRQRKSFRGDSLSSSLSHFCVSLVASTIWLHRTANSSCKYKITKSLKERLHFSLKIYELYQSCAFKDELISSVVYNHQKHSCLWIFLSLFPSL